MEETPLLSTLEDPSVGPVVLTDQILQSLNHDSIVRIGSETFILDGSNFANLQGQQNQVTTTISFQTLQTPSYVENQAYDTVGSFTPIPDVGPPQLLSNTSVQIPQRAIMTNLNPNNNYNSFQTSDDVDPPIGKGPFHCQVCGEQFNKWQQLKRHKIQHLDEKSFRCRICSSAFNFENNFNVHMIYHEAEASGCLECKLCPDPSPKFSRLASLKSHLRIHEREDSLVCLECGDEFPTKMRLDTHLEEHKIKADRGYQCNMCKKSFDSSQLLKEHSKSHDTVRSQLKVLNSTMKKRRRKPIIEKDPDDPKNASYEKNQREEKKKQRVCHFCDKRFQKPSQLSRHLRIHTGEKPFSCSQCDKKFNQKGTLDSHIRSTHVKAKPYECASCNIKFAQRGNLKAHVLKVHIVPEENEKVFKCEECSCVYRRLATLNSHISKAHATIVKKLESNKEEPVTSGSNSIVATKSNPIQSHSSQHGNNTIKSESLTSQLKKLVVPQPILHQSATTHLINTNVKDVVANLRKVYPPQEDESVSEVRLHHDDPGSKNRCKVVKIGKFHCCEFCNKTFKKPSDLIRHRRIHTNEKPFVCEICNRGFAVKSTYSNHKKIHSAQKNYHCRTPGCGKSFHVLSSLRSHEKYHSEIKAYACSHPNCNKSFRTSSQRKVHGLIHSRQANGVLTGKRKLLRIGELNIPVELPDPLEFTENGTLIPVPRRSIATTIALQGASDRPYKCNYQNCPAAFKKSSHLKQHTHSHTNHRPYSCFQCNRSFTSSGSLKMHIRTHQNIRNHICNICHLSFTTGGSLKRHKTTHSEKRDFYCPYCSKSFKTSVACRKHIKIHRSEIAENTSTFSTAQLTDINQRYQNEYGTNFDGEFHGVLVDDPPPNISLGQEQHTTHYSICSVGGGEYHLIEDGQMNQEQASLSYPPVSSETLIQHPSSGQFSYDTSQYQVIQPTQSHNPLQTQPTFYQTEPNLVYQINETQGQSHTSVKQEPVSNIKASLADEKIAKIQEDSRKISEKILNSLEASGGKKKPNKSTGGRGIKCETCSRVFKKQSDLSRHNLIHTGEKPFQCIHCNRAFRVKSTLESHVKTHQGGKHIACHICHRLFSSSGSLRVHMRLHTGDRPYPCSVPGCSKSFRTTGHMKNHLKSHVKSAAKEAQNIQVLPPVQTIKEKSTQNQQMNLSNNVSVHILGGDGSAIQISGLDMNPLNGLNVDESFLQNLSNLGNVIFLPQEIGPSDTNTDNSNKNIIVEFQNQESLNAQPSSSLPSNPAPKPSIDLDDLICRVCDRQFSKPHLLKKHMNTHNIQTFKCSYCEYSTGLKRSLRAHFNKQHPGNDWKSYEKASIENH